MLKKIISNLWIIRYIFKTIYFNFKCLPFNQAIHLPVLLCKPEFVSLKGRFIIDAPVSLGLIRLGQRLVSIYGNNGVMIENNGIIIFKGKCVIGNGAKISVGASGVLEFGDCFCSTAEIKIVCYDNIKFGKNTLVGWECFFIDTDLHQLSTISNEFIKSYSPIIIGHNCWFACRNTIMKGCLIPPWSVISTNSLLNRDYSDESEHTLFAGQPAKAVKHGIYFDFLDKTKSTIKYVKSV